MTMWSGRWRFCGYLTKGVRCGEIASYRCTCGGLHSDESPSDWATPPEKVDHPKDLCQGHMDMYEEGQNELS